MRNALLGIEHHGAGTDAEHHRHPLVVDLYPFDEGPYDPSTLVPFQPVEVGAHRIGEVFDEASDPAVQPTDLPLEYVTVVPAFLPLRIVEPPAAKLVQSPYDTEARYSWKREATSPSTGRR